MAHDGGSWNGVWPANLTEAAHIATKHASAAEARREMFSPYGRGSRHQNPRGSSDSGARRGRRPGSAPPAMSRRSLSDFVGGGGDQPVLSDPYKTPVASSQRPSDADVSQSSIAAQPTQEILAKAPVPYVAPAVPRATAAAHYPPVAADVRDVSAAVSRWANKSLAELLAGKGVGSNQTIA